MFHKIIHFFLIQAVIVTALEEVSKINLVKIDLHDTAYRKLMTTEEGILSAPPLAVLDILKLRTHECFQNLRTEKWTLAVPIMFWNQTYMDKITASINMVNFFKKFDLNVSSTILPPSGIMAYRLNWRRKSELLDTRLISIDNSWYTTQFDYVLPKVHNFIIEFESVNGTSKLCNSTKKKLVDEVFQCQELSVTFMTRKMKSQNNSRIHVTIKDVKATKMFNDTGCQNKERCFVTFKYAEKWSYEVSTNVMSRLNIVHLSLQKEIYDATLNYLCKDKVPVSEIESQTITKLVKDSSNEMGCSIGKKVYSTLEKLCRDQVYGSNYYGRCNTDNINYQEEVIASMNSVKVFDDRNVFNIPVIRW